MGHQFSKSSENSSTEDRTKDQHPASQQQQMKILDNDGMSRATELTGDESISPCSSPAVAMFAHSQSWRSNANPAVAAGRSTTYPSFQQQQQQQAVSSKRPLVDGDGFQTYLVRRDSDPSRQSMRAKRSDPVKCPNPRKTQSVCGYPLDGTTDAPPEEDHGGDASYLERMYDSRTWAMYQRITEARKQAKTKYSPTDTGKKGGTAAAKTSLDQHMGQKATRRNGGNSEEEWENLQHEEGDEKEQHEMVFLFDF